jgi:predicted dehydrogenase
MKKVWKIGIVKDTSKRMLGLHGLHMAFYGLPDCEVVALVDSNPENIEGKLAQVQAQRHYVTLEGMLEKETPDIVVLTSRHPGDHLEQIRQVAERGCHIYCEKPISVFPEEAYAIAHIVKSSGVKLAMAHPARHDLAFRTMKNMIEASEIGVPVSAVGHGKCDHRGGGEDLIVLGTHILDLMVYFWDRPESVMADIRTEGRVATVHDKVETVEPIGPVIGDDIFAMFSFTGGIRGTFETRRNWRKQGATLPFMGLCVEGTEGSLSLRFDDQERQPLLYAQRAGPARVCAEFMDISLTEEREIPGAQPLDYSICGKGGVPPAPWFLEANRFAAWDLMCAIEEDRQPQSNLENAGTVVEMICGIYASHLQRRVIDFPLKERTHPLIG